MTKSENDKKIIRAINAAKKIMQDPRAGELEAETRRRVEDMFSSIMGYKEYKHVSRELAITGTGVTEHCDFAISAGKTDKKGEPIFDYLVELKKGNQKLGKKEVNQGATYCLKSGYEWFVLTNGIDWRLYLTFYVDNIPGIQLVESWNLLEDKASDLLNKFELIGYKNVRRGGLEKLKEKATVLTTENILKAILSEQGLRFFKRELKKAHDVNVNPEDIVSSIRKMLSVNSQQEMDHIKIKF